MKSAETFAHWRDRFAKSGVAFVAVHQPRSEDELDVEAVRVGTGLAAVA